MNRQTIIKMAVITASTVVAVRGTAATAEPRPNIVFVEADDLMYRFMGSRGRGFTQTPNLDALAKDGVYFQNAVCQGMMCGPSRNSLVTGLYPHNIGFYKNGQMGPLPDNAPSFPAAMKNSGYTTAWVGKCHVHSPMKGERKMPTSEALQKHMGFDFALASVGRALLAGRVIKGRKLDGDVYIEHLKKRGLLETYINDCKTRAKVTSLPEDDYLDGFYTKTAEEWISGYNGKKPFFLWLNLSCPHGPHDVPQKYHDMYKDIEIPPPLTDSFGSEIPAGLLAHNKAASAKKLPSDRKRYAAATTFVDTMLGRIIKQLKTKGVFENTVIVFFSDHGIFMGNHGRVHKGSLFNEITNPSLIVYYPKQFKKGLIEDSPVELLGLVKTCLELADADNPEKENFFSESLLPLLTGKGEYKTEYVFSEIEGFQSCFNGRYRYIANSEKPLLYDLKNDPGEMHNIAAEHPEVAERMQKATDTWFKRTGAALPAGHLRDSDNLQNWKSPASE